jgi:hypothetical protein
MLALNFQSRTMAGAPESSVCLEAGRPVVDLVLAVAVAMTTRLVALLIVWIHQRQRSARAYEMVRRLPAGSRYIENNAYVMIEIGSADSGTGTVGASK